MVPTPMGGWMDDIPPTDRPNGAPIAGGAAAAGGGWTPPPLPPLLPLPSPAIGGLGGSAAAAAPLAAAAGVRPGGEGWRRCFLGIILRRRPRLINPSPLLVVLDTPAAGYEYAPPGAVSPACLLVCRGMRFKMHI